MSPRTRPSNAAHAMPSNEGSADVVERENALSASADVRVADDDAVMRSIKRITREHRALLSALAR